MKDKKVLIGRIVTGLVCLFFAFNVITKLFWTKMYPQMPEGLAKMGLQESIIPLLAFLEAMCTIVYLIPATSVMGAVLYTGYLGGAMLTHIRVGEPVYVHIIIAGFIWLGIYLREPRLWAVLPIRKK